MRFFSSSTSRVTELERLLKASHRMFNDTLKHLRSQQNSILAGLEMTRMLMDCNVRLGSALDQAALMIVDLLRSDSPAVLATVAGDAAIRQSQAAHQQLTDAIDPLLNCLSDLLTANRATLDQFESQLREIDGP